MIGYRFSQWMSQGEGNLFKTLLKIFKELLLYTSGDIREALEWLTSLDNEYKLTDDKYGIADFIQDLIDKGYISKPSEGNGGYTPSSKMEIAIRKKAFDDLFGKIKKTKKGGHSTQITGRGDEHTSVYQTL